MPQLCLPGRQHQALLPPDSGPPMLLQLPLWPSLEMGYNTTIGATSPRMESAWSLPLSVTPGVCWLLPSCPSLPWKRLSGPIQLHLDLWQGSRSSSLLHSVSRSLSLLWRDSGGSRTLGRWAVHRWWSRWSHRRGELCIRPLPPCLWSCTLRVLPGRT